MAALLLTLEGGPLLGAGADTKRTEAALSSAEVTSLTRRSVVVIECSAPDGSSAMGSGFYVDPSGFIASNAHVVAGCSDILIRDEGSDVPKLGRALLLDEDRDIAIVGVQRTTRPALTLASPASVQQGQRVYAVGHPEGLEYTVSEGIVSAFRDLAGTRLIQTTAPISPGSSGGPLVNSRGQAVGMTTLFLKVGQNLNFAVPADAIRDALAKARRHATSGAPGAAMSPTTAARIARSLRERRDFEAARTILNAALKESPSKLDLLLESAELALGDKRLTDVNFFVHAMHDRTTLNLTREREAEIRQGRESGIRSTESALTWSMADHREWFRRAGDAERIARQMLDIDPHFAPAHEVLGFALMAKSKYDEGRREFRQCLDLNPDPTHAMYRAQANAMLYVCSKFELSNLKGLSASQLKEHPLWLTGLRYLEAALEWDGFRENSELHTQYALDLWSLSQISKANAAAKYALALPTIGSDERAYLEYVGLPQQQVRVVSQGQTQRGKSLGMPIVTGVVKNDGTEVVSFTRVIVECKDRGGAIVGTGTGYVEPTSLRPGESGSFEILLKGPIGSECDFTSRIAEND